MEYNKLPDLKSLATLQAVVERGGVSEAAKLLNIGQPAVTKRLRSLETLYATPIMERVSGRLQLTDVGQQIYQFAVLTTNFHQRLQKSLADLNQGKRTLRLEVTMAIGEHFLPAWLVRFADTHPQYRVESRLAYGRIIEPRLAVGQIDLAVMENAPDHPDVLVQQWRTDEIVMVCGAQHPIARRKKLRMQDLFDLNFVLREKNAALREHMDRLLEQHGIQDLNISMEVGSTAAIIDILHSGRHVSFLPLFAVASEIDNGQLVTLPIKDLYTRRTLWIVRHRMHLNHPVANAFIEMLQQA
ncbi:MAG: LysR family transcriptional regulator [Gammaproteobacteria bacterium]|nr:LysR family transcriptional regulator [Gammaproteobacteria bacterium]MDH5731110.1 LysR family transcriptional regulator [Gammaproteobacteria bacterium]